MSKSTLSLLAALTALAACTAAARTDASVYPADSTPMPTAPEVIVAAQQSVAAPSLAHAAHYDDAAPIVSCDIRTRRTANGVLIEARAFADRDIAGEYDLAIVKSGGGNSSEINQGGPLEIAAGSTVTLGQNELSVEPGARLRAVLTLRDEGGELCRRSFRL
ncbi:MAG: curli-like amyloid fiber formation chaperone CsgH [Vitreimonas sp.]